MTPEQQKILDKFKEIWKREFCDGLKEEHSVSGYYISALLAEVFQELNKES